MAGTYWPLKPLVQNPEHIWRLGPGGPWPGGPLARGPWALQPGRVLGPGALGPKGPWPRGAGLGGPWPGEPLARGPWPGGARGALGPGPLARAWKSVKKSQNHEIEQPACLDPSPASWSRNPATRDQGAPGGGGPTNPEPKTLNHLQRQRVTIWGYTLATLKVVWVPAIP